ncbi:MAG: hypothetical protein JWQ09_3152 [Segetibacter sp.]|nr:hypothetical protein [Segetibacter sp.]
MEGNNSPDRKLVHISEVTPINEADKPVMDELYQVLKKHNALERFGITLLHEHFPIDDDEALIETTDSKNRTQTLITVKKKDITQMDVIESSWRLDTDEPSKERV